jgi:hypothetical protein
MPGTTIDLTTPPMAAALDAWAADLDLLPASHRGLLASLRDHLGLPDRTADDLVAFEQVRSTQCVKLAGEWWWVRARRVAHDLQGVPHHFLVVGDKDTPDWEYEATDGERFLVSEPF